MWFTTRNSHTFNPKSVGVLYPKPHTYKCQLPKISRLGKLEGFSVKLYAIVRIQKKEYRSVSVLFCIY